MLELILARLCCLFAVNYDQNPKNKGALLPTSKQMAPNIIDQRNLSIIRTANIKTRPRDKIRG